ncbi:MAG: hypothetical protein BroJett018_55050 [Chloroflexota bacterium]|nr:MAG: hypothetical protein BroJett018_55050 [Chloroflexota bacterium]
MVTVDDGVEFVREGVQIGADLGQRVDPTAIIVAEKQRRADGELHYVIRHVERLPLNTSYPAIVERLAEIYKKLSRRRPFPDVLVDATGVGSPVVDLLTKAGIDVTAVYLTGGEKATYEGSELRLPKQLMVSRLQVLLQQRLIHLPDTPDAAALVDELLNFEIKVTDAANLQFGAFKVGSHDDLAVALGLACWEGPDLTIRFGDPDDELTRLLNDYRG